MTVTPEMIEIAEEKLFGNAKRMARRMGAEFVLNEQGHELVRQKAIDDMSQASPPPQDEVGPVPAGAVIAVAEVLFPGIEYRKINGGHRNLCVKAARAALSSCRIGGDE